MLEALVIEEQGERFFIQTGGVPGPFRFFVFHFFLLCFLIRTGSGKG